MFCSGRRSERRRIVASIASSAVSGPVRGSRCARARSLARRCCARPGHRARAGPGVDELDRWTRGTCACYGSARLTTSSRSSRMNAPVPTGATSISAIPTTRAPQASEAPRSAHRRGGRCGARACDRACTRCVRAARGRTSGARGELRSRLRTCGTTSSVERRTGSDVVVR